MLMSKPLVISHMMNWEPSRTIDVLVYHTYLYFNSGYRFVCKSSEPSTEEDTPDYLRAGPEVTLLEDRFIIRKRRLRQVFVRYPFGVKFAGYI